LPRFRREFDSHRPLHFLPEISSALLKIPLNFRANSRYHARNWVLHSMTVCRIAVGSTRRPKLNAVRDAAALFKEMIAPKMVLEIQGYEVESGVGHTPASREELMRGARQRAEAVVERLRSLGDSAAYFVGLEGGLDVAVENGRRCVLLESWAYVTDGRRGHFGCSGSIELPDALAEDVLSNGWELSEAIDRFAGAVGIRDAQGAWGVLSGDLISRQEAFRVAVVAAFAPFYNPKMYGKASAAGS
jgi:inosine/xanthosine triphosphatase